MSVKSDIESLAFVEEEEDGAPASDDTFRSPQLEATQVPPPSRRPRIVAMPQLHPPMATSPMKHSPAKPPLHHAATPVTNPVKPLPCTTSNVDAGLAESSEDDSIFFAVENGSLAGTPMRRSVPSKALPPPPFPVPRSAGTPTAATTSTPAAPASLRRLSRASSTGSIQFNIEPDHPHGTLPTDPHRPGRVVSEGNGAPVDIELPSGSHSNGTTASAALPSPPHPTPKDLRSTLAKNKKSHAFSSPRSHSGAAGASILTNDSIAFHVEEAEEGATEHQPSVPSPQRSTATPQRGSNAAVQKRNNRSGSIAGSSVGEFMDNSSIAFVMEDEKGDRVMPQSLSPAAVPRRSTGTPLPRPLRRSLSVGSRPASRPLSPSIQFDIEHTDKGDDTGEPSDLQLSHGSPMLVNQGLPTWGQGGASTTTTPEGDPPELCLDVPPTGDGGGSGGHYVREEQTLTADVPPSSTASLAVKKKTIVTDRLQRQRKLRGHTRLPQPSKRAPLSSFSRQELPPPPPHPGTHPPFNQQTAISAPLAAQTEVVTPTPLVGGLAVQECPAGAAQHRRQSSRFSMGTFTEAPSPRANTVTAEGSDKSEGAPSEAPWARPSSCAVTESASLSAAASPMQGRCATALTRTRETRSPGVAQRIPGYEQAMEKPHDRVWHRSNGVTADSSVPSWHNVHEPHPSCADGRLVPPGVSPESGQEIEKWRQFNETQRAELAELRTRIAIARREDRTLLEGALSHQRKASTPRSAVQCSGLRCAVSGGGASSYGAPGPHAQDRGRFPSRMCSQRGGRARRAVGQAVEPRNASARRSGYASPAQAPGDVGPTPPGRKTTSPSPTQPPEVGRTAVVHAAPLPNSAASTGAAAAIADMLGILWPPRLSSSPPSKASGDVSPTAGGTRPVTELYFVNGSRLTPEQVARFFELVEAPTKAAVKNPSIHIPSRGLSPADTLSPTKLRRHGSPPPAGNLHGLAVVTQEAPHYLDSIDCHAFRHASAHTSPSVGRHATPISAKLSSLLPRKSIRRSRVLRKAFDAMDLKRQGSIMLLMMPSLTRLFEDELAALEHKRASLSQGQVIPLRTLLESAVQSRQRHIGSWCNGRERICLASEAPNEEETYADGLRSTSELEAELACATHRLLLLSFAVNVVIPIISVSRIPVLDFATVSMLVYAAVDKHDDEADSLREEWRRVVQEYFIALDVSA